MNIQFKCAGCGRGMNVRQDLAGKKLRCKECGAITPVPMSNAEVDVPVAAPLTQMPLPPIILSKEASRPLEPATPVPTPAPAAAPQAAKPPAPMPPRPYEGPKPALPVGETPKPAVPVLPKPPADQTINFKCSGCSRPMNVRSDLGGKKIRCKGCGGVTVVPAAASDATPASAPSPEPAPAAIPPPDLATPAPAAVAAKAMTPMPAVVPPATPAVPAPVAASPMKPMTPMTPMAPATAPAAPAPSTPAAAPGESTELAELRRRAEHAEKSIHDLAGQHALEKIGLTNRIIGLETQVRELELKLKSAGGAGLDADARKKAAEWFDRLVAEQDKSLRALADEGRKLLTPPSA